MNGDLLFKGKIVSLKENGSATEEMEIIYRIINFSDIYFFAEEISTGSIFPTYSFAKRTNSNYNNIKFKSYSFLHCGKYFVFLNLYDSDNILKYSLCSDNMKKPSIEEVNKYLEAKKNDCCWKEKMQSMEEQNNYCCDLSQIKEKIAMLKEGHNVLDTDLDTSKPCYVSYTPNIDLAEIKDLGYDLSTMDNLCNSVGREKEKKKITKNIAISGNSVMLVGEPGSGKTSIVESLALDIRNNKNKWLNGKIIFYLSTASLVSGTNYRGTFEEKLQRLIDFCKNNKGRIILFIDEMHTLYGLGRTENSSIDAMNILKPYISSGDITVIGATTKEEYKKYMANDPAFVRRHEKVDIPLLDKDMNIEVLLSYIKELENKYKVLFDFDEEKKYQITDFIVEITDPKNQRVVGDIKIENPTISKRVLEEAFTETVYNGKDKVTIEEICYAILSCDKLTSTAREKAANDIKKKLSEIKEEQKVLEFPNNNLKLMKTK